MTVLASRAHAVLGEVQRLVRDLASETAAGFDDQQSCWSYAAAIENPQSAFRDLMGRLLAMDKCQTILQVGAGGDGTRERALECIADSVLTVESPLAVSGELLVDVLLIDCDEGYQRSADTWRSLARFVRDGGLIAIVDRSQERVDVRRADDVDRFAYDLDRRFLQPRGRRLERIGYGHAIHVYERQKGDDEARALLDGEGASLPDWRRIERAEFDGFSVFERGGRWVAVPGMYPSFSERARSRHTYDLVLTAASESELRAMLVFWSQLEGMVEVVLRQLATGDDAGLAQSREAAASFDACADGWLERWLLEQPHGRRLLRAAGVFWILAGDCLLGSAILQRRIDDDLTDGQVISALAQVHLRLRQDSGAAQALLAELRCAVQRQQRRQHCQSAAPPHQVWSHPELLGDAMSMLWIGAGGAPNASFARELGISMTWLPHGHPTTPAENCRVLNEWVGGAASDATVWRDPETGVVTLRPYTDAFACRPGAASLQSLGERPLTNLDALLASGSLGAGDVGVLILDVPGEEAEILRGAERLLRHVRMICVALHHHAVYVDTAPHHELVRWLEERGFAFTGADPTPIGHRVVGFLEKVE